MTLRAGRPSTSRNVETMAKFRINGHIYYEFVPTGQTVKKIELNYKRHRDISRIDRGALYQVKDSSARSALSIREFQANQQIPVVHQPP